MGRMSRSKGARGEREWAEFLRSVGIDARRGRQYSGSPDSPDVVTPSLGPIHFEVKRVEAFHLYKSLDQAREDAGDEKTPVVAHRKNKREWIVVMDANDFLRLVGDAQYE